MVFLRLSAAFAALFFLQTSFADARTTRSTVASGKTAVLGYLYVYTRRTCHSQPYPKFEITQPEHGRITVTRKKRRISANAKFCAGKVFNALQVTYRSRPGYRGTDTGRVLIRYPSRSGEVITNTGSHRYRITVK